MSSNDPFMSFPEEIKASWGDEEYARLQDLGRESTFFGYKIERLPIDVVYVALGFALDQINDINKTIEEQERFLSLLDSDGG